MFALLIMAAGALIVSSALVPFRRLRSQLIEVRDGRTQTISGSYPNEIQPVIDDLNRLLIEREQAVRRAQAKAGNLAHGLKTPLAIMAQEAERAQRQGQQSANILLQQVERMRRQIEYHLAQARAGARNMPAVHSSVRDCADALTRTLKRLYADRALSFCIQIPGDHFVRVQREDLEEMLGNVLDNACKWAKSRIALSSHAQDGQIWIVIEDDGPGISPPLRESVWQRGVRTDETTPGSGLGLAIVRELAELHSGSISLDESTTTGLKVNLSLPRAFGP
ncbi:MAG: HAMP domain-containing histidine kinase [Acidobacteriaceae bacterium]|nr:HAMP domain-containing histidine kinase [Acidobacteriaceae bacterium]